MTPSSEAVAGLAERLRAGLAGVTPGPWKRGAKRTIGYVCESDDQSDGMLIPIADVYGENPDADAAWIELCNPVNIAQLLDLTTSLASDRGRFLACMDRRADKIIELQDALAARDARIAELEADKATLQDAVNALDQEKQGFANLAAAQNGGNRFATAEWTKTLLKLREAQKERDAVVAAGEALSSALNRYGFPMSEEAWRHTGDDAPANRQASVEARALHRAALAFFRAVSGAPTEETAR